MPPPCSASRSRAFSTWAGWLGLDARRDLRLSFQDLVLLRTAKGLADAKVPAATIRRSLKRLRAQLPEGRAITGVRIAADGRRVVARDGASVWNPESGQALFDFAVAEVATAAAPHARKAAAEERARKARSSPPRTGTASAATSRRPPPPTRATRTAAPWSSSPTTRTRT